MPQLTEEQAKSFLTATPEWMLNENAKSIQRTFNCKTFVKAIKLMNDIADVAEAQQHHPDLHLTGYRHLAVELTTHAIGGLSENDFIVAAHIDQLPSLP